MQSVFLHCLLLKVTSLLYIISDSAPVIHYVLPDNYTNSSASTLHHYMNYPKMYFASDVELHFLPCKHHLNKNLIVNNIFNYMEVM